MLSFLADENFNGDLLRGVLRQRPDLIRERVQDVGLSGADDPTVLEWAAQNRRVLLTHDVTTMTKFAYERVEVGLPMAGVLQVRDSSNFLHIIKDIILFAEYSREGEWEGQVRYIPF